MTGQTLVIRKILPASREAVFDAWLDAGGMREWMCPGSITSSDVTLEPRVGGHFRIVMRGPQGKVVNTGEYRVLNRPAKLEFTWASDRWGGEETLVTVEPHQRDAECELVLTHQRFPMEHSTQQLEKGWGEILEKLARSCVSGREAG
jgi:uncharacterized protein YndB with AHSA1/START domain